MKRREKYLRDYVNAKGAIRQSDRTCKMIRDFVIGVVVMVVAIGALLLATYFTFRK